MVIEIKVILLCLLLLSPALPLHASQDRISLNMEEAISMALSKNNEIRAGRFAKEKANWDKKQAKSQLLPTLSLNSRYSWVDDDTFERQTYIYDVLGTISTQSSQGGTQTGGAAFENFAFQDTYTTSLDLSMPLFNGALLNGISISKTNLKMATQADKSTRDQIVFLVIRGYLNVIKIKEIEKLQKEYLELSRLNYERAKRLHKANRYSKAEIQRWRVELQQQKSVFVNSQSTLRSSLTYLTRLLNLPFQKSINIDDHVPDKLINESKKIMGYTDKEIVSWIQLSDKELIKVNTAISAAKSNEEISRLLHRNTYTAYMPSLYLNCSYGWEENRIELDEDRAFESVTINFNMPLFTGFKNYTATKSSYYDYKQSREAFLKLLQDTRFTLTETANKLINLKTQKELSKTNVEFNESNYRIVEQKKGMGLISNLDFIDAKLNLQNAKLTEISTHYDFISAMVEIYYLLGKLESIMPEF